MLINNVLFNAELPEVLTELQTQLAVNNIQLLQKTKPTLTDIQVQCPYHAGGQEKKPSAGIRRSDGLFHCFACGAVHTLPEVISFCFGRYDDVLGKWGWNWLNRNFATVQVEERKDVELDFTRFGNCDGRGSKYNRVNNNFSYVSKEELDSYRYFHPYMYKRGLTDEIIELFDIGYDKNSDCITFPVRDINGNTLFIARRSVKTKFFNYPEGVEKPLYGLYELCTHRFNEVIVTESMLDALSFWVVGKFAVALNGTGNELQFKQLRELPCRELILATDSDEAGMKARQRIRDNVKNKLITEYIFPEGRKDANECTTEELLDLEKIF